MLDKNDRVIVESIRNAQRLRIIVVGKEYNGEISFAPSKRLNHDIALAVQSHYNRLKI